jgi:hypothetical protein
LRAASYADEERKYTVDQKIAVLVDRREKTHYRLYFACIEV